MARGTSPPPPRPGADLLLSERNTLEHLRELMLHPSYRYDVANYLGQSNTLELTIYETNLIAHIIGEILDRP